MRVSLFIIHMVQVLNMSVEHHLLFTRFSQASPRTHIDYGMFVTKAFELCTLLSLHCIGEA